MLGRMGGRFGMIGAKAFGFAYGPHIITPDATGWGAVFGAGSMSLSGGAHRVTSNNAGGVGLGKGFATEIGATYEWDAIIAAQTGATQLIIGSFAGGAADYANINTSQGGTFVATTTMAYFTAYNYNGVGTFSDYTLSLRKRL